ncbi:hypothetical protein QT979_17430 [Microcoleus sp. w2-18bC1]|uniref:hypothetical protein n=1 Tax=unclassified Microcoleus TaxID=2642155 RepID=UPI002FD3866E
MINNSPPNDDLQPLSQAYFELAKKWWWLSISCKFFVFLVGLTSALLVIFPIYAPFLAAILEIASEISLWRSDTIKDIAEALRRKLDARDSFGWSISNTELSDLYIKTPDSLHKLAPRETQGENYFASQRPLGEKKALENIQESAWWSKHLSEKMFQYCLVISLSLFVIVLGSLIICIQTLSNRDALINIGRIVTSSLMLFFVLGLFRRVIGYYEFSQKASQIESRIEVLLNTQNVTESDAIKIMHEYQLARSSSPLIPSFIWKQMRGKLNIMWTKYRQQQTH